MMSVFTREKSFADPWVGHAGLNRLGLHRHRIALARAMLGLRRALRETFSGGARGAVAQMLDTDGVAVLPNFLAEEVFARTQGEARQLMVNADRLEPRQTGSRPGFQTKINRPFGFDRHDGGTLNRFIPIDPIDTPACYGATDDSRLSEAALAITGGPWRPGKWWVYETLQAGDAAPKDPQTDLHRDTFFPDLKCWLFLEDVGEEDGPFAYVVGSHMATPARLAWEQGEANRLIAGPAGHARGGSLRCDADGLEQMGLPAPTHFPVAANTLVIANTFGFHKRTVGKEGALRLALYGHLRPAPFGL